MKMAQRFVAYFRVSTEEQGDSGSDEGDGGIRLHKAP